MRNERERTELLALVADLWRGDWSGSIFDGRDGQDWIFTALHGSLAEVKDCYAKLRDIEERAYR